MRLSDGLQPNREIDFSVGDGRFPWSGFVLGLTVAIVLGIESLSVIGMGPTGPDDWWFFMTVLMGYLFTSWLAWGFQTWRRKHQSQLWIPIEFVPFFFLILFGALFRVGFSEWAANAFDAMGTIAKLGLFGLGVGLPVLVYLEFIRRVWTNKS